MQAKWEKFDFWPLDPPYTLKELLKWVFTNLFVYKNQYTFHAQINRKKPDLKISNTSEVIPPQRWPRSGCIYEFQAGEIELFITLWRKNYVTAQSRTKKSIVNYIKVRVLTKLFPKGVFIILWNLSMLYKR